MGHKARTPKLLIMGTRKLITVAFFLLMISSFEYCSKKDTAPVIASPSPVLPAAPFHYSDIVFPAHVQQALSLNDNMPSGNSITDAGATLGRVLFYDKNLSKNNTISCGSCHKQAAGFTDNVQFSKGFEAGLTTRTSMNLLNLRFYRSGKMFWDERALTLEDQVLQPVQNHVEMGMTLTELVTKLKTLTYYPSLFNAAFGGTDIDTLKIERALAQFLRAIVTYQAKYDRVKQGIETFTAQESAGEQLFLNTPGPGGAPTCGGCHTPPMFLTSAPQGPFGLPDPNDAGISNQNRFKAGSLRNVTSTTNLFHNGSVANVQAMLASNIPAHGVAPQDRANILAFLQTLVDNSVIADARFSDPFK
jgi:cytochrome c peroxidase